MSALGGERAGGLRLIRLVLVAIALGVIMNSAANVFLYASNRHRVQDVCDLVVNTHTDRVKRYRNTLAFLATPAGMQRTALNDYIRDVSSPQTRAELVKERRSLPRSCVEGRRFPKIPRP